VVVRKLCEKFLRFDAAQSRELTGKALIRATQKFAIAATSINREVTDKRSGRGFRNLRIGHASVMTLKSHCEADSQVVTFPKKSAQ
jgi:hypothetical protein